MSWPISSPVTQPSWSPVPRPVCSTVNLKSEKKKKKILPTNSIVKLTVEEDVSLVPGILTLMKGVLK